jgi:hypothetical protein
MLEVKTIPLELIFAMLTYSCFYGLDFLTDKPSKLDQPNTLQKLGDLVLELNYLFLQCYSLRF